MFCFVCALDISLVLRVWSYNHKKWFKFHMRQTKQHQFHKLYPNFSLLLTRFAMMQ